MPGTRSLTLLWSTVKSEEKKGTNEHSRDWDRVSAAPKRGVSNATTITLTTDFFMKRALKHCISLAVLSFFFLGTRLFATTSGNASGTTIYSRDADVDGTTLHYLTAC